MMRYRRLASRYTLLVAGGRAGAVTAWRPGRIVLAEARWRPETDVYETPDALSVTIELAGVDPDALEVLLFDDALVVEGERRLPPGEAPGVYRAVEILQGPFRVQVPLEGVVDAERVDARYEQGLLRITVPKAGR
jgi:HSP20 family protein